MPCTLFWSPGTLPETICDARTVNVISLDGLTSSDSCTSRLWDPWHYFKSGYFARSMRGAFAVLSG